MHYLFFLIGRGFLMLQKRKVSEGKPLSCRNCSLPYALLCKESPCQEAAFDVRHRLYTDQMLHKNVFNEQLDMPD
jgi:hypothetical protein